MDLNTVLSTNLDSVNWRQGVELVFDNIKNKVYHCFLQTVVLLKYVLLNFSITPLRQGKNGYRHQHEISMSPLIVQTL